MKVNHVPSATLGSIRVVKLKKATDNKLLFRQVSGHPLFIEIIYADKSLGTYETNNFNEIILLFLKKLAKFNNGSPDNIEAKLEKLEKNYLVDKNFVDEQLSQAENFSKKDTLKKRVIHNFLSYPLEYSDDEIKDIIGVTEKQNIVRRTLEEYNMRMKDLASAIGMNVNTLRSQASKNDITPHTKRSIELYIENIQLKKELEKYKSDR